MTDLLYDIYMTVTEYDILHTRMVYDMTYCRGCNYNIEEVYCTGGFTTNTVTGSSAAILLLAALLRYWCVGWVGQFYPYMVCCWYGVVCWLDWDGLHYCTALLIYWAKAHTDSVLG